MYTLRLVNSRFRSADLQEGIHDGRGLDMLFHSVQYTYSMLRLTMLRSDIPLAKAKVHHWLELVVPLGPRLLI